MRTSSGRRTCGFVKDLLGPLAPSAMYRGDRQALRKLVRAAILAAEAELVLVDPSREGRGIYSTISAALKNVKPGGEVMVRPGNYTDDELKISRPVTISNTRLSSGTSPRRCRT